MKTFLITAGALSALYGLGVLLVIGPRHWFNWFYFVLGIAAVLAGRNWEKIRSLGRGIRLAALAALGVLLVLFAVFETACMSAAFRGPAEDGEYLVLLGCQVRYDGPSRDLWSRIRAAEEYLSAHPGCKAVVTGGQGDNEPMTEAEAAARELMRMGIDGSRIIREEESTSTRENLLNAMELIRKDGGDPSSDSVVIVSADYHLFRAAYTARKLGYGNVSCKGGNGLLFLKPHYFTREFAAFAKELFS